MGKTSSKDALNNALRLEQVDEIRRILKEDPTLTDCYINASNDQTSLCMSVYYSSLKSIKVLIEEFNHDLNKAEEKYNYTPLIIACKRKETNIAKYLIERGADITLVDRQNLNCLDYAVLHAAYDICFFLITKYPGILKLKPLDDYVTLNRELNLTNFNILSFYQCLNDFIEPNSAPSFRVAYNANKNLEGKVPNPDETWQEFLRRILNFKLFKPPMIEKDKVPLEKRKSAYMRMQSKLLEYEFEKKINLDDETEEESDKLVDVENPINIEMKENITTSVEVVRNKNNVESETYRKIDNENYSSDRDTKLKMQMKDEVIQN